MEAHVCDPRGLEGEEGDQELEAIHGYTVSLKLARAAGVLSGQTAMSHVPSVSLNVDLRASYGGFRAGGRTQRRVPRGQWG